MESPPLVSQTLRKQFWEPLLTPVQTSSSQTLIIVDPTSDLRGGPWTDRLLSPRAEYAGTGSHCNFPPNGSALEFHELP